jgi:uroporphyrinogen decarboxylase
MKFSCSAFLLSLATVGHVQAFSPNNAPAATMTQQSHLFSAVADEKAASANSPSKTQDPLLIRAAKGEKTERVPVWMMRQAGRHMKKYRDLCKTHTTFRQRSEIAEVAVEISLQPYQAYQTDGCILFSDILTPFPGMGMDFTIDENKGPIMPTIRSWEELKMVRTQNKRYDFSVILPWLV